MVGALVKLFTLLKLPPVAAVVLSTLLTAEEPMGLKELSEVTGYAKSHLSMALKLLENGSLVERVISGKKARFRARKEAVERLIKRHLRELRRRISQSIQEMSDVPAIRETLEEIDREVQALIKRLGGDEL